MQAPHPRHGATRTSRSQAIEAGLHDAGVPVTLSVSDVAKILGRHCDTVRALIIGRDLLAFRQGSRGRLRIMRRDLAEYIAKQSTSMQHLSEESDGCAPAEELKSTCERPREVLTSADDSSLTTDSADIGATEIPANDGVTIASDGTWLRCGTRTYHFSKGQQARVILTLYEVWEEARRKDGCGLSEEALGEAVGSSSQRFRIQQLFRRHEALNHLLRSPSKGVYALYLNKVAEQHAQ
jgi:hypothetical protein